MKPALSALEPSSIESSDESAESSAPEPSVSGRAAGWASRRGSLRTQLIAWNILVLALLLGGLGFLIRYTVHSTMLASIDRELEIRARHAHDPQPRPGSPPGRENPPFDEPGPNPGPADDLRQPPPGAARRNNGPPPPEADNPFRPRQFDLQGHSVEPNDAQSPWDPTAFTLASQGQTIYSTVTVHEEPVRVLSCPFPDPAAGPGPPEGKAAGPIQGVIQAPYPLTEVNRAIVGLDRALLMLIPVGLICAGLGGAALTDRVLKRVRRMTHAAETISAQEFSRRLPVTGNDEFSELAETFNGLLGRLETAFNRQESLLEQQRRFTAAASHELKTPLTIIKGHTSMTLISPQMDTSEPSTLEPSTSTQVSSELAPYRQSLQEIDRAADTMSHLVQDLLLLARSDGGQLGRNPIKLLAREMLEQALAGIVTQGRASLTLDVVPETLCVMGNEGELTRLFSNLIDNALRYTPPNGHVLVTARSVGSRGVITIADTGVGIAPEHLPHLGERFYRVDASRTRPTGGTGLGLSICKGIVDAHQGTMTFASVVGQGTTVTVMLASL